MDVLILTLLYISLVQGLIIGLDLIEFKHWYVYMIFIPGFSIFVLFSILMLLSSVVFSLIIFDFSFKQTRLLIKEILNE